MDNRRGLDFSTSTPILFNKGADLHPMRTGVFNLVGVPINSRIVPVYPDELE
jgi:hypothetical protein